MLSDERIKAKVDTGAKTSALHAENIRIVRRGGVRYVRFTLLPHQRSQNDATEVIAKLLCHREVRSSNGKVEKRPVVETRVQVRNRKRLIELTLTERQMMGFRMLLGRQALRELRATVNPALAIVKRAPLARAD